MDSWFDKLREKLIADKVQVQRREEEELDSDEERKRKESQLTDTLRKLNTDDVLIDDEILRVTESVRKTTKDRGKFEVDESRGQTSTVVADMAKSVLTKPAGEEDNKPAAPAEPVKSAVTVLDDDEHFEPQFWD